jgi:hypothetical protein
MKIVVTNKGEYADVINSYYNLEKYNDNSTEDVLFQGYASCRDPELLEIHKDYKKRRYLNLEAPCAFTSSSSTVAEHSYFTHVYSICPYTCEWLNRASDTKHIPIPFPFNLESFKNVEYGKKEHDVIYMGPLLSHMHVGLIEVMANFNYIHTSKIAASVYTDYSCDPPIEVNLWQGMGRVPTHINITSEAKWDLLSKSKISVAINAAPLNPDHVNSIKSYYGWETHGAFSHLDHNTLPQFKPRVIESMVCKTLVLVKRDYWNVIERWFEQDKHFIYWDNLSDLKEKMDAIINNYDSYQHIIDAAYDKVMEYEINNIFKNNILNDK